MRHLVFPYGGGVNKYICVDINRFMHKRDIYDTLEFYKKNQRDLMRVLKENQLTDLCRWREDIPIQRNMEIKEFLKNFYFIDYRAPCDAGDTNMESGSIDYIIANTTLQHIPEGDLKKILRECARLLKADGIMSVTVSYLDHYANVDKSINRYNFLKYTDEEWKKYNPSLHYQNRLRHTDYKRIFMNAGFEIIDEDPYKIEDGYFEQLDSIDLAARFKIYDRKELILLGSGFVLKKQKF